VTFSIVALDVATGLIGAAISTARLAVGARCLVVSSDLALATQGLISVALARKVHARASHMDLTSAVASAVADDSGSSRRQLVAVARTGDSATFDGADLPHAHGSASGENWACGGNTLASPDVIDAMATRYSSFGPGPLPNRLIDALLAGDTAGGDRRGRQSAALRVMSSNTAWPGIDLRVDDHPDPVRELGRLFELWRQEWEVFDATGRFPPARPASTRELNSGFGELP